MRVLVKDSVDGELAGRVALRACAGFAGLRRRTGGPPFGGPFQRNAGAARPNGRAPGERRSRDSCAGAYAPRVLRVAFNRVLQVRRSRAAASSGGMSRCALASISYPTMNFRTDADRSSGG